MDSNANRVFISYRRDDAAGYAGRLEEALERRLGPGSVFRDVLDLAPGEDFVAAIAARLARARAVLVLIGPRWAGGDGVGSRRIDQAGDLVRIEVATALQSRATVIPVLLPGAAMPSEASLPPPLQALARRNALSLGDDSHWEADVERLVGAIGRPDPHVARRRTLGMVLAGVALAGVAAVVATVALPRLRPAEPAEPADPAARLLGAWQADVRYAWGDRYRERFEFKRHAGELTGTATFLGYPRGIVKLELDRGNLHFETHSQQSMNNSEWRELTHRYDAELRGNGADERLALRMQTLNAFDSNPPLEFEARRVEAGAAPAAGR